MPKMAHRPSEKDTEAWSATADGGMPRWQREARASMRYRQHRAIAALQLAVLIGFVFGTAIGHANLFAAAVVIGVCVFVIAVQYFAASRARKAAYTLDRETNDSIRVVEQPLKEPL